MKQVIIGCGPAGIAAAETIRSISRADQIAIISDEGKPLYSRCLIPYRLTVSGGIDISYREEYFFEKLKIVPLLGRKAVRISSAPRAVYLDDGQEIGFERLLIATGGRPRKPDIPGLDKDGVIGFRTTSDCAKICGFLPSAKTAAVLGGGCIGLQVASGLMSAGVKVTIIIKSAHLLSQVADETAGGIYAGIFSNNGAEVVTGSEISSIEGGRRVERVRLESGREIECQLLVIAKGVSPNIEIAREAGIGCGDGIMVNANMMTDVDGMYAAGDVAETVDAATGRRTVNALWPCASEQGRIAGSNMAGVPKEYESSLRMNAVEFFGLPMISVGSVKPPDARHEVFCFRDEGKNIYRKLVFNKDILIGLIMIGEIDNAGVLTSLIRKRAGLGRVKDELIAGRTGFSRVIEAIMWNRDRFSGESYDETLMTLAEK